MTGPHPPGHTRRQGVVMPFQTASGTPSTQNVWSSETYKYQSFEDHQVNSHQGYIQIPVSINIHWGPPGQLPYKETKANANITIEVEDHQVNSHTHQSWGPPGQLSYKWGPPLGQLTPADQIKRYWSTWLGHIPRDIHADRVWWCPSRLLQVPRTRKTFGQVKRIKISLLRTTRLAPSGSNLPRSLQLTQNKLKVFFNLLTLQLTACFYTNISQANYKW